MDEHPHHEPLIRYGHRSVDEAVEAIRDAVTADLLQGREPEREVNHFFVENFADSSTLDIVTVEAGGSLGDRGCQPLIRIACALQPIAAATVEPRLRPSGDLDEVWLSVQDPDFRVEVHSLDAMDPARGFDVVAERHLDDGEDFPLLPEAWEWEVSRGQWMRSLEEPEPRRAGLSEWAS